MPCVVSLCFLTVVRKMSEVVARIICRSVISRYSVVCNCFRLAKKHNLQSVRLLLANNQNNHVISSKSVGTEHGINTEKFFSFSF